MHHNFANLLLPLSILLQAGKQSKMNLDKVHFIVLYVVARIIGCWNLPTRVFIIHRDIFVRSSTEHFYSCVLNSLAFE